MCLLLFIIIIISFIIYVLLLIILSITKSIYLQEQLNQKPSFGYKLSPILLYHTALIPQFILLDQKLIGK